MADRVGTRARPRFGESVRRGASAGLAVGVAFAAITVAARVVLGSDGFDSRFGPAGANVVAHLIGGTTAGVIVELLLRFVRSRRHSVLVGTLAMIPYCALVVRVQAQARGGLSGMTQIGIAFLCALLLGGYGGYLAWQDHTEGESPE